MVLCVDSHANRIAHVIKARHADDTIALIAPVPNARLIINRNFAFIAVFVNQRPVRQNLDFDLVSRHRPHLDHFTLAVSHQSRICVAAQQVIQAGILPIFHWCVATIWAVVQQGPQRSFACQSLVALSIVCPFVNKQGQRCDVIGQQFNSSPDSTDLQSTVDAIVLVVVVNTGERLSELNALLLPCRSDIAKEPPQ